MQTQQYRPAPKPKQRLNVGEIVIAAFNLFLGVFGTSFAFVLIRHEGLRLSVNSLIGLTVTVVALVAGLTSVLVFLRQPRLATSTQWLTFFGVLIFGAVVSRFHTRLWSNPLFAGTTLAIALLLAGFAWFLKRMDDDK